MDKDYLVEQQRLTELAAAFGERCARAQETAQNARTESQNAYQQALTDLYAVPRGQVEADLRGMEAMIAEIQRIQNKFPADGPLLADVIAQTKPLPRRGDKCLDAFSMHAKAFLSAARSLCVQPAAQDQAVFERLAASYCNAKALFDQLDALLDRDYPTREIKARLRREQNDREEQIEAACREQCDVTQWEEYASCRALCDRLDRQAAQVRSDLLSCDRLGAEEAPERILLGRAAFTLSGETEAFWRDSFRPDPDAFCANPFYLELHPGMSSLVVNATGAQIESRDFESMLVTWFLQFLVSFPVKSLHVCGMQGDLSGVVCSLVSELTNGVGESITFDGPKATEDAIAAGVDRISSLMEERIRFYGRKYADIYDYNAHCPDTPQPFVLVLIHNYPYAFEERSVRKKVENLLESGGRCGILTLLVNHTDAQLTRFGEPVPPLDAERFGSLVVTYTGAGGFTVHDRAYKAEIAVPEFSEGALWQLLADSTRYVSRPIQLDSLLHEPYERTPYYDELKIPVGRSGNQVQYFRLDVESTGKSAALIAGGTGSGKTTFLHTLILSGAMAYSPAELEYYLIDFKDGVEFSNYLKRQGEASAYIPHVSFVSLKNRVEDAYDVLHKISNLKEQRNRLFHQAGATDFKTYHMSKKVQSGELPRLKRTVVIIDEYQNMLEATGNGSAALAAKCAARLLALLKEIRNAGISIILSSQAICVGREAKDQIFNRIVFSGSENTINSAFETSRSGEMMNDLQQERGLAYQSEDGGVHAALFKAAWAGKTNGAEHQRIAKEICGKWADVAVPPMIISGNEAPLPVGEGNSALSRCLPPEQTGSGYLAVLGQSFLSDEPVGLELSSGSFSGYVMLGELPKLRALEASAALSFLQQIRAAGCAGADSVIYCDLNYTSQGRTYRSPLEEMASGLGGSVAYIKNEGDAAAQITRLHALYHARLDALKAGEEIDLSPKLLIVSSARNILDFAPAQAAPREELSAFDRLLMDTDGGAAPGARELTSQLELLYTRGYEQHIFVILTEKEPQRLRELIPRGIRYERAVFCSREALAAADWSSSGEYVSVDTLAANCCVVLPNVSKVRPYQYENWKGWFDRYRAALDG